MTKTLTVALSSVGNPDLAARGGYWTSGRRPRSRSVAVASLAAAVEACGAYIAANDLGGGNWTGGLVERGGVPVARIAYNGRVFEITPEGAARGRTSSGALFDDRAREIDVATGEPIPHVCFACGAPATTNDIRDGKFVLLCRAFAHRTAEAGVR